MGSGASVRPSPNAVTDTNIFFVANASNYALRVVSSASKNDPTKQQPGPANTGNEPPGGGTDAGPKQPGSPAKSEKSSSVLIPMREVREFRGRFVEIFLVDKHDKETPLGAQRPTQPCRALIVTDKKSVKASACALSGVDDRNAWIAAGGANLFPCVFFVANASGGKLVVVSHDARRADIDARVVRHGDVVTFRGEKARIFTAVAGKEIHNGDAPLRTSLIVTGDDQVLRSRQLVGDDVETEKWITADGKYCKPKK